MNFRKKHNRNKNTRKHHNNKGLAQIKRGYTRLYIQYLAKKYHIPYRLVPQKGN